LKIIQIENKMADLDTLTQLDQRRSSKISYKRRVSFHRLFRLMSRRMSARKKVQAFLLLGV
jgi:hypothetical protein